MTETPQAGRRTMLDARTVDLIHRAGRRTSTPLLRPPVPSSGADGARLTFHHFVERSTDVEIISKIGVDRSGPVPDPAGQRDGRGERRGLAGRRTQRHWGARAPASDRCGEGPTSTTEILEYALAKVALEDDFGAALVARKGRTPRDLDLEL